MRCDLPRSTLSQETLSPRFRVERSSFIRGDTSLAYWFHSPGLQIPLCLSFLISKTSRLGTELQSTGSRQCAGTELTGKLFPHPGGGGQRRLSLLSRAWRGGYQRRQFAVAIPPRR